MNMTATNPLTEKEWVLGIQDRCDSCQARAYVKVTGVTGSLLFCSHHYNKIMNNPTGYESMKKFAFEITDEREHLEKDN